MPATDAFDKQDAEYRESVLPSDVTARIAVEAGIADFWYKYVGFGGKIIGMTTFGESAPAGTPTPAASTMGRPTRFLTLSISL